MNRPILLQKNRSLLNSLAYMLGQILLVFFPIALIINVQGTRPNTGDERLMAAGLVGDYLFDFVAWESEAVFDKISVNALDIHAYLTFNERTDLLEKYSNLLTEKNDIEMTVSEFHLSDAIPDPILATVPLTREARHLQGQISMMQNLAEAIISQKTTNSLEASMGSDFVFPPVSFRATQMPSILVLSPRDSIERTTSYDLVHGLLLSEIDQIESSVEMETGYSALIIPIGGLSIYPAMVLETPNLANVYEIVAHEWVHHYLSFFPLGMHYERDGATRTMNETTANIIGREVGLISFSGFLHTTPSHPETTPSIKSEPALNNGDGQIVFDFNLEMRATRIIVDRLLSEGRIDEAESFMEERRVQFVNNGYQIRKLNQAYFAFYGSYADTPGFAGDDPVGPAVIVLREQSDNLGDFLRVIRGISTFDELIQTIEDNPHG